MPLPISLLPAGYLLALGPLLFISICDVWLQLFSHDQAYAINLAAVGTVAFGCTGREWGQDAPGGLSPRALWPCCIGNAPYEAESVQMLTMCLWTPQSAIHTTHMHTDPHAHQGDSHVAQA